MPLTGPRRIQWFHVLLAGTVLGGMVKLSMEQPRVGVHVLCVTGSLLIACISVQYYANRALQERVARLELLAAACGGANARGGQDVSV